MPEYRFGDQVFPHDGVIGSPSQVWAQAKMAHAEVNARREREAQAAPPQPPPE